MITTEEVIRAAAKEIEEIFTIKDTNKNAKLEQLEKENSLLRAEVESLHKVIGSVRDLCNKSIIEPTVKQPIPESWKSLQDKIKFVKPSWICTVLPDGLAVTNKSSERPRGFQITHWANTGGFLVHPTVRGSKIVIEPSKNLFHGYNVVTFIVRDEDHVVRLMVDTINAM